MHPSKQFPRLRGALAAAALSTALASCQAVKPDTPNAGIHQPVLTPVTMQNQTLRTVPRPARRIPVAVYDFPDLTGQYKELDTVQTLSRAVTQGGAPMLIKALQDAGERRWFSVLDRARLDDILKERQIATEMRRLYRNEERIPASVLPPLSHAGIIMQGGIVGYDTNSMTGGLGVRYLGIGADTKWRQDNVTVTLRAVSTNTGEVLASVTIHKMVVSTALQGGAFRYLELDKILEAEAGISQNEPKQIAVQQAIEKAVIALIMEGAELNVWSFADPEEGRKAIEDYRREKYGTRITDAARNVPPPATPNAAAVVETVPIAPQVASAPRRQRAPAAARPPAAQPEQPPATQPPPGSDDEVVGSVRRGAGAPPPPDRDEVVGAVTEERKPAKKQPAPRQEQAARTPAPAPKPAPAPRETVRAASPAGDQDAKDSTVAMGPGFSTANAPQPVGYFGR